jgi:hypothetical protein
MCVMAWCGRGARSNYRTEVEPGTTSTRPMPRQRIPAEPRQKFLPSIRSATSKVRIWPGIGSEPTQEFATSEDSIKSSLHKSQFMPMNSPIGRRRSTFRICRGWARSLIILPISSICSRSGMADHWALPIRSTASRRYCPINLSPPGPILPGLEIRTDQATVRGRALRPPPKRPPG